MATFHRLRDAGGDPQDLQLPDLDGWQHQIVNWLFEVGPGCDGKAITWPEIAAWRACTGTLISPNEAIALRSLSLAYMNELMAGRDPLRGAPYNAVIPMREEVNTNLKMALRAMRKGRK
jgi:hypothetical protein